MSTETEVETWGDHPPGTDRLIFIPAIEHWDRRVEDMMNKTVEDHEPATFIDRESVPVRHISIRALEATKNYAISVVKEPSEHKTGIAVGSVVTVAGLLALTKALHTRRKK